VVVLGSEIVDELFEGIDPVGQTVELGGQPFEVAGVFSHRGSILGESLDREVLIPREALERYFGTSRSRISITARAMPGAVNRAVDQMTESLRRTRRLRPADDNDFVLETQESLRNLTRQITGSVFIVVVAIASVALLVGGIGVMNIMLVSVTERTREIGVRKALGATRAQIRSQFLAEATALTGVGGILGILFGVLTGLVVDLATPIPSYVPLWTYLTALGVSCGVGLFFGSWPAIRASRLDPVAALRHE
jgi:putative ABC transport system permease protein